MFCSLSATPASDEVFSLVINDVGSPKACSSCVQYHSQSQSSAVREARFSSASEGMCRCTMQWRTSRREVGGCRVLPGGNHDGRSRVRSIWVSR